LRSGGSVERPSLSRYLDFKEITANAVFSTKMLDQRTVEKNVAGFCTAVFAGQRLGLLLVYALPPITRVAREPGGLARRAKHR
jgi:hypothetical protein